MTSTSDYIHVAFAASDDYLQYVCVTIKSIIINNPSDNICIHILSDFISEKSMIRLNEVCNNVDNILLSTHIIDDRKILGLKDTWSKYTWYRLLIPDIISTDISCILYLDTDIIVTGRLKRIFSIDMSDKSIAGVTDPLTFKDDAFKRCKYEKEKKYICAGVLMMNLDYWREKDLSNTILNWARENNDRIIFPDQDTINYICRDTKIVLPLKYGFLGTIFEDYHFYRQPYLNELKECLSDPIIIHYGGQAPWKKEIARHPMQNEWIKYNKMLKHPAKSVHVYNKWISLGYFFSNLLFSKKNRITIEEITNRIILAEKGLLEAILTKDAENERKTLETEIFIDSIYKQKDSKKKERIKLLRQVDISFYRKYKVCHSANEKILKLLLSYRLFSIYDSFMMQIYYKRMRKNGNFIF